MFGVQKGSTPNRPTTNSVRPNPKKELKRIEKFEKEGLEFYKNEKYPEAIESFRKSITLLKRSIFNSSAKLAQLYVYRGNAHFKNNNDIENAAKDYVEARSLDMSSMRYVR